MKILGFEITKAKNALFPISIKNEDVGGASAVKIKKIKPVTPPVLAYRNSFSQRGHFEPPEYNLNEIGRVEDVESYVRQSFRKKCGLMFKEGWELDGSNPKTVTYIQERFKQLEAASGYPFGLLLRETAMNLIKYSNAYWAKVRDPKSSGGGVRTLPGTSRKIPPVAAYFQIPPEMVEIKRDETGKVLKYRQTDNHGKTIEFDPLNIVHFFFDRKTGFSTGTPFLVPVLDDIRALRRIEENIELLVYQHLFPLFHYKVGTEQAPAEIYPDGTSEVDIIKREVQFMPSEGGIVTPERHEITSIGSEGRALRAEGYLTHFKKRVFAGLGLSAVDFGEGETANRATADNMSRSLVDDVKAMQDVFEDFINEYVFKELLLESTFPDPTSDDNIVFLSFNEVDLDAKIKVENHKMTMYQGFLLTEDETRRGIGLDPITEEGRSNTFFEIVKKPSLIIQSIDEKFLQQEAIAAPGIASEQPEANKANEQSMQEQERIAKAKAKATAANRVKKSSVQDENVIKTYYNMLKSDTINAIQTQQYNDLWFKGTLLAATGKIHEKFTRELRSSFRSGVRKAGVDPYKINLEHANSVLGDRANKYISKVFNRLSALLHSRVGSTLGNGKETKELVEKATATFDSLEFRTDTVYRSELHKASIYGLALGLKALGHQKAKLDLQESDCEECLNNKDLTIDLNYVTIDDVPGLHPNCQCSIKPIQSKNSDSLNDDLTAKEERCVLRVKQQLSQKYPDRSHEQIKVSAIKICRSSINNESEADKLVESFKEEDFDA